MKNWKFWTLWSMLFIMLLFIAVDMSGIHQAADKMVEMSDPVNRIKMFDEILKGLQ